MTFIWIGAAVLMIFNAVYCAVKIKNDVLSGRQGWAAIGILGIMGVALAIGAIKVAADHAMSDMAAEALRDF